MMTTFSIPATIVIPVTTEKTYGVAERYPTYWHV